MATKQNTAKVNPPSKDAGKAHQTPSKESLIARQIEIGQQLTVEYAEAFKELAK